MRITIGLLIIVTCVISVRPSEHSETDYNYEDSYDYETENATNEQEENDYQSTTLAQKVVKENSFTKNVEYTSESVTKFITSTEAEIPEFPVAYCQTICICKDQDLTCSNKSLPAIPKFIPNVTLSLDLSDNIIEVISENNLNNLIDLRVLILSNNKIQNIHRNAFRALTEVYYIDLSSNFISNIDSDIFENARSLTILLLNNNPIVFKSNEIFLNLPTLVRLDLVGCNITELYNDTFKNLSGLASLNMANNVFTKDINLVAFNPINRLLQLKIPEVSRKDTFDLCTELTVIDVISFDNYNISCYELISGSSYEESTITQGPPTPIAVETTTLQMTKTSTDKSPSPTETIVSTDSSKQNISDATESSKKSSGTDSHSNVNTLNSTNNEIIQTKDVEKSSPSIKTILIVSIIIACCGLIIGLICRKDLFGVKTKLCRTQRPEPPTIPEQVPLNKV